MEALNRSVFQAINRWPEWMAPTMRFFSVATDYGWFKVVLGVIVLAMLVRGALSRRAAVQALIAFPIANGLTDLLKHGLPMNRPYAELGPTDMILRIGHFPTFGDHPSFGTASAHSANMAAVAFVFCYHLGWYGAPWALIALMTGLSRIYNGVHYPYQVLLGWACGLLAALVVTKTWEAVVRRRTGVIKSEEDGGNT